MFSSKRRRDDDPKKGITKHSVSTATTTGTSHTASPVRRPPVIVKRTVITTTTTTTPKPVGRATLTAAIARHGQPGFSPINSLSTPALVKSHTSLASAASTKAAAANGSAQRSKTLSTASSSASSVKGKRPAVVSNSKRKTVHVDKKLKLNKQKDQPSNLTVDGSSSLSDLSSDDDDDDGSDNSSTSESSSGSSDEGSYEFWHKGEGTHLVERSVVAQQDGDVNALSAKDLVMANLKAYKHHFIDLSNPERSPIDWAGSEVPTIELEYPGRHAKEAFPLLLPKRHNEYDPIEDVLSTIRMVLDEFLTPAQSLALFGYTANSYAFSAFLSAPTSRAATPGTPTDPSAPTPPPPLMRSLNKARSKRDGPSFLAELERYNAGIRSLRDEGKIEDNIRAMTGLKQKVWEKITMQVYDRAVGPGLDELSRYEAFSDNVYGELLPKFMAEIFDKTKLGPNDVFVDLGSGVGNCVIQAAIATGCEAWGFENMAHASSLARAQVKEAEARYRMWGLAAGAMQVIEADFCEHPQVGQVMQRATVVLVNNEVFTSSLNNKLSLLFLDLADSTRIVSLKAFAAHFKLTAHNRDSPLAILHQGPPLRYPQNSVSWKNEPGTYYVGEIRRQLLREFDEKERVRADRRAVKLAAARMRRTASAESRSQTPQTPSSITAPASGPGVEL